MGKYTRLFIDETRGYLGVLNGALESALAGSVEGAALSESCRLAHSIKGMALFEEQAAVADLAHALEKAFGHGASRGLDAGLLEEVRKGLRLLAVLVDEIESGGAGRSDPQDLVREIERHLEGQG